MLLNCLCPQDQTSLQSVGSSEALKWFWVMRELWHLYSCLAGIAWFIFNTFVKDFFGLEGWCLGQVCFGTWWFKMDIISCSWRSKQLARDEIAHDANDRTGQEWSSISLLSMNNASSLSHQCSSIAFNWIFIVSKSWWLTFFTEFHWICSFILSLSLTWSFS